MLTAVLALFTAFAYTVHDYLVMRVVRVTPVLAALFWVQLAGLALLVPLWLVFGGVPEGGDQWRSAAFAALTGPVEVVALAFLLKGLAVGKLSVVGPLAALGGGFGAAFAILLGERVAPLAMVGLPLAVAGAVLASIERSGEEGRGVRGTAGAGWGLLCALVWGIEPILISEASLLSAVSVVTIGRISSLLLLAPVTAALGGFALRAGFRRRIGACAVADIAGFIAWVAATALGPVATASVLSAQTGTMSALFGTVALRERPTKAQLVGIAAAVAAVTLLALGESV